MLRNLDYMRTKWFWIGLSLVITVIGLISIAVRGFNLGLDFSPGTRIDIVFQQPVSTVQLRTTLTDLGYGDAKVQVEGTDQKEAVIITRVLTTDQRRALQAALASKLGQFELKDMDSVAPEFSRQLVSSTAMAVIIASVGMLLYITIRFEIRFAAAGIIALLHDALILTGIFSIIGKTVDIPFIAAILTMLGYSIMDTIVVYDRIRENMQKRQKNETLEQLVNRSIGEVIGRSIKTSVTTLLAIGAVYFFGGPTTKDFSLALIIGIISGTYSSIFIASPIWLMWRNADENRRLRAKAARKGGKGAPAKDASPKTRATAVAKAKPAKAAR